MEQESLESFISEALRGGKKSASFATLISEADFSAILSKNGNSRFYFSRPGENYRFCSSGAMKSKEDLELFYQKSSYLNNFGSLGLKSVPRYLIYSKFSTDEGDTGPWKEFRPIEKFIPRYIYIDNLGKYYAIMNFYLSESFPNFNLPIHSGIRHRNPSITIKSIVQESPDRWKEKIGLCLNAIKSGSFQKLVLSRTSVAVLSGRPETDWIIRRLEERFPGCSCFFIERNGALFFGASPEMLLESKGEDIWSDCLAGSCPEGSTETEDRLLGSGLLTDKKNLQEHRIVLKYIKDCFERHACNVEAPENPGLKKLPGIRHLHSQVKGQMKSGEKLYDIVSDLHPTPALSGFPKRGAAQKLKEIEGYDRGLFGGYTGYMTENGSFFCVNIRSGLLTGKLLRVFAGCGIVPGSDPETEYEESSIKSKTILGIFQNESE